MKNRRNYYRVLHVQPDAPAAIIKSSYRTLMQKLKAHPDLGGDDRNAALINEAFAVIIDPVRRASYDRDLRCQMHRREADPETEVATPQTPFSDTPGYTKVAPHTCPFCQTRQQPPAPSTPEDVCAGCNSPLQPASRIKLEGSSKRAVSRIAKGGALRIFTRWPQADPYPGAIIDLSPNGSRIALPLALPTGTVIKMEGNLLSALTRVVSCQELTPEPGFHLGTEFLTLAFARMRGTFLSASA